MREFLTTGWGRVFAVASALAVVIGLVNGLASLADRWSGADAAATQRSTIGLLSLGETPVPGYATGVLGFGDALGGRPVFPYVDKSPTSQVPTFNSFVDLPYGAGDERAYMRVQATSRAKPSLRDWGDARSITAGSHEVVWVRVAVDNNAPDTSDCSNPGGSTVANNARLRVTVWQSLHGDRHVIRTWISADNASPRWITDAVEVDTPVRSRLVFNAHKSGSYAQIPKQVPDVMTNSVIQPAGWLLGVDGVFGSCWTNRQYMILPFEVRG